MWYLINKEKVNIPVRELPVYKGIIISKGA